MTRTAYAERLESRDNEGRVGEIDQISGYPFDAPESGEWDIGCTKYRILDVVERP